MNDEPSDRPDGGAPMETAATVSSPQAAPPPWQKRRRWLPVLCVLYAVCVVGLCLAFRFLSDRWWPVTWLLFAPRWPWLLPLLGFMLIGRRRGHGKLRLLAGFTGLLVLGPLMGFNVPWHRLTAAPAAGPGFRLMTCNVHRLELSVPDLDLYILQTNPDVIVLQDYSGWDDSAVPRAGRHTFRQGEIFIASRFPIRQVRNLKLDEIPGEDDAELPRYTGAGACFDLDTPAGLVHLLNIHLASPHTGLTAVVREPEKVAWKLRTNSIRRFNECAAISNFIKALSGPVILAGDFNMLDDSPIFRQFWGDYADAFESHGWGYGYTHYTPLSQLRLDHVLFRDPFDCLAYRVGPDCGTPHRPLVVDLATRR